MKTISLIRRNMQGFVPWKAALYCTWFALFYRQVQEKKIISNVDGLNLNNCPFEKKKYCAQIFRNIEFLNLICVNIFSCLVQRSGGAGLRRWLVRLRTNCINLLQKNIKLYQHNAAPKQFMLKRCFLFAPENFSTEWIFLASS